MKLRKLWPVFGLMCMSLFSTASAHPYSNSSQSDSMPSQGSMDGSQGTYQRGTYREITPNAGPRVAHGADVFITADFIWWKAVQEGTDYATTGFTGDVSDGGVARASSGNLRSVGRDWAPGFKVGLGLNLSYDGWDIYAQYTWLRPSNSSSISGNPVAPTCVSPLPVTSDGSTLSAITRELLRNKRISSSWDLDFNVIDVELGRSFFLSQFLTLRPYLGFKGTWQEQKLTTRIENEDGFTVGTNTTFTGPYKISNDLENWGIGSRIGLGFSWFMAKNWSIFGHVAWTAMWVDYDEMTRKDTVDNPTKVADTSTAVLLNVSNNDHYSVKSILELELALRWDIWFYDDNYHFAIQAGWEEQVWNNWATYLGMSGEKWNDLNFHGLNLKLRFDF